MRNFDKFAMLKNMLLQIFFKFLIFPKNIFKVEYLIALMKMFAVMIVHYGICKMLSFAFLYKLNV